jgi:RNA polymerase sigma factor (sigma-70 family)
VVDAVQSALAALPDLERQVMMLRGIEQLTNRAVAQQLGIDDYQVTRHYQRALALLREALPGSLFAELD